MNNDMEEVKARMRRIETKVYLIGEKVGVDIKDNVPFEVVSGADGAAGICIPGYDITLSRIKRDLTLKGIDPFAYGVALVCEGKVIGYVEFFK